MSDRQSIPSSLAASPVIAIVRGGAGEHLLPVCEALLDRGIVHLEITTNTPGWEGAVADLAARESAVIGVGTVLTPEHVARAAGAGASFVVAPNTDARVGEAAAAAGLGWYPGAFSPTEIALAWQLGATAVKVFPAAQAGGPAFIAAVRAPLPHILLVPTGGVGADDARAYLQRGAVAVGLGSPLLGDALEGGSIDELRRRADAVLEAVRGG